MLICSTLMFSFLTSAGNIEKVSRERLFSTIDDDVPIWENGNSWTYTIDEFTFDYEEGGQKIYFDGSLDDFTWTVSDTDGDVYIVDFTAEINCEYEIYMSSSSVTLSVTGNMKSILTRMTGTLVFTKSNLQLQDMSAEIRGITAAKLYPIPIPLPIPFKATIETDLSTEFPLYDFPLSSNKFWNLPNMDIVVSVNVGGIFGLISIPITYTTHYSWTPLAFHCKNKQDITVEAGTFNAWEIESTFFDLFNYYYSPEVGNLIKIQANMPNGMAIGELKSTNYS